MATNNGMQYSEYVRYVPYYQMTQKAMCVRAISSKWDRCIPHTHGTQCACPEEAAGGIVTTWTHTHGHSPWGQCPSVWPYTINLAPTKFDLFAQSHLATKHTNIYGCSGRRACQARINVVHIRYRPQQQEAKLVLIALYITTHLIILSNA